PREPRALYDQIVTLLANKISQAQAVNQDVPVEAQALVLEYQAQRARRENQPAQAIRYYQDLTGLAVSADRKDQVRLAMFELALENRDNVAMLSQGAEALASLLGRGAGTQALDKAAHACAGNPDASVTALQRARLLAVLIVPVMDKIPAESRIAWQQRVRQAKIDLVDQQLQVLAEAPTSEDVEAITVLSQLDSRLWDYPAQATVEKRRETLEGFRKLLTQGEPAAPPAPADHSAAESPESPEPDANEAGTSPESAPADTDDADSGVPGA
ncbi:MAG: hypothetical protein JW741_06685, partial [Sedimentisphaerales bacterium]|nr:hypothetical protein [Sedimentisphaerales bacterium]